MKGGRPEVREVADRIVAPGDADLCPRQPVVRSFEEPAEEAQLVEDLHGRGVDRVAAEIAEEIGVLFQHPHRNSGSGEQQPGHHASRPAADNYNVNQCSVHPGFGIDAEYTVPLASRLCSTPCILSAVKIVSPSMRVFAQLR
jgi:hypothetical protein